MPLISNAQLAGSGTVEVVENEISSMPKCLPLAARFELTMRSVSELAVPVVNLFDRPIQTPGGAGSVVNVLSDVIVVPSSTVRVRFDGAGRP
jgi:hypothetical protein